MSEAEFKAASERVLQLKKKPSSSYLLKLYGLYKQGSVGDIEGKRPGLLDIRGRAKYDAWKECVGMEKGEARNSYVVLVEELEQD